jgi:hypothetical protein
MYSFALNPKEHQPSGTLNFSEISNAQITWDGLNNAAFADGKDSSDININVYYNYETYCIKYIGHINSSSRYYIRDS